MPITLPRLSAQALLAPVSALILALILGIGLLAPQSWAQEAASSTPETSQATGEAQPKATGAQAALPSADVEAPTPTALAEGDAGQDQAAGADGNPAQTSEQASATGGTPAEPQASLASDPGSDPVQAPEVAPVPAPVAAASALTLHQQASLDGCLQQAAPQQYGGPAFADLQPDLALAACELAWQVVPSKLGAISAYIGRIMEAQGETKAAYWLYRRAVADDLPVGYGLLAYRLMRQGDDDAKAALLAETGHALGDWNASNVLATLYAQNRVPGKGPSEALALIEYVAEQGSPFAQYLTAWLYETHEQAPDKALAWYEKAVANGEQAAAAFLADLLERGVAAREEGDAGQAVAAIEPNFPRAAALYWQALQRGDAWAAQQFIERGKERPGAIMLEIQKQLAAEGFAVGEPDGVFGRRTEQALRDLLARAAN